MRPNYKTPLKSNEIELEHVLDGGFASDTARVPLLLRKLRQAVHAHESVATGAFSLPALASADATADDDGGWQWKLQVYPNGQSNHPDKLIVYVILTNVKGTGAVAGDDSTLGDQFRVLEQRLLVNLVLRYEHKGEMKKLCDLKTHLFKWAVKPARWTRHEFVLADVLRCGGKAELVCQINEYKQTATSVRRDYAIGGYDSGYNPWGM